MNLTRLGGLVLAVMFGVAGQSVRADDDKKLDDKTFVEKVAIGGMAEVEISKSAQTTAQNQEVKKFADKMIKDHTALSEELKTIAAGIPLTVPARIDDKVQKEIDAIQKLSGAEFDRGYMDRQVKCHEEAIECFKKADKELTNTRLKEFAAKALPKLEEHLKDAKSVRDQLK